MSEVHCPYCERPSMRMTGRELHPTRHDLAEKHFHVCRNCDAWIGCRDGTWEPLGRLANAELRRAKQDVHIALEPIWQSAMTMHNWTKSKARNLAYIWLATEMSIPNGRANIGDFDLDQCKLVKLICAHREADLLSLSRAQPRQSYAGRPNGHLRRSTSK